jgi:uncharacterized metal-binding protein YceD (DUF177 family)
MSPELHYPLPVERIGPGGLEVEVRAGEAECAALAARMGFPALRDLVCGFRLSAAGQGTVLAEGHLRAVAVRVCVLTLDEFEAATEERFRLRFVPAGQESDDDDPESDDEIAYVGGVLDLGEAAAEQLALALDPYPRKPDARLPGVVEDPRESPFAGLAPLARRR